MTDPTQGQDPNPPIASNDDWGEQVFQAGMEFAINPEPRCPCVLLLDTSRSMHGPPIDALNEGLRAFRTELLKDSLARKRVEIAIIAFGGDVQIVQEFVTVEDFQPTPLEAYGQTPMGTAILTALDLVEARKQQYREHGITYYRPWVFMITDGEPKGEPLELIRQALDRIKAEEASKKVAFFAVGVERANMKLLSKIAVRTPLKLRGLNFVQMFVWLSRSTGQIAHSRPGEQTALPPQGWGTVE